LNVLVDTSVWVDHFMQKQGNPALQDLLMRDQALTHPMVVLELACGTPPAPRARTLGDMQLLRRATQATNDEVMAFIEREQLFGLGCGLVDISLLASALLTPDTRLWTLDQRLQALAARLGVEYQPLPN
jgi:predicted nucleic acid-binding protein